ncbi:MAG: pyridoxamine 5'-phosphate oxidase family protein [Actinomycetota bacterium]
MEIHPDADEFLRERLWGTLATTRSSGAPQVSMVAYDWDGTDLVISCRGSAAKYVNASRRSDVVFTVVDDIDCCTVTGTATCHATGDERDAGTERVRQRLLDGAEWGAAMLDRDIEAGLDQVDRVTITVTPTDIRLVQPLG